MSAAEHHEHAARTGTSGDVVRSMVNATGAWDHRLALLALSGLLDALEQQAAEDDAHAARLEAAEGPGATASMLRASAYSRRDMAAQVRDTIRTGLFGPAIVE